MTSRRRSHAACIFSTSWLLLLNSTKGQSVHNLGRTRSSQQPNHLLLTPDTFVRTTLPGMKGCSAIVHVGPAMGARFTEYTAEFEARGEMVGTRAQRFIFVIEGSVKLETTDKRSKLGAQGYAYVP